MAVTEGKLLVGWTVVVADDEQFSRSIVLRMVRELGCADPLSATTGQEALNHLQSLAGRNALLLCDFNMPGIDGLTLTKLIRTGKLGGPNGIPVVMLTGYADSGLVAAALALDVDGFVVKPASLAQLATRLGRGIASDRDIKAPKDYVGVDVDGVGKRMLRNEPVGLLRPSSSKSSGANVIRLRLQDVAEGQVLAEDICAPTGERLLGAGVPLTPRYLQRLQELAQVLNIEYLAIVAKSA